MTFHTIGAYATNGNRKIYHRAQICISRASLENEAQVLHIGALLMMLVRNQSDNKQVQVHKEQN